MSLSRALPLLVIVSAAGGGVVAQFIGASVAVGVAIGLAAGMTPIAVLSIGYLVLMAWRPDRPTCRCGKCQSEQYELVGPEQVTAATVFEYRCPFCGRAYRQAKNRFWELARDGSEIPYMSVSRWGRWQLEVSDPTPAAGTGEPRR